MEGEDYAFAWESYLACLRDGEEERYFLYMEGTAENDYRTIYVYDLNGEQIRQSGELSGSGFHHDWNEEIGEYGVLFTEVFNDPSTIILDTKLDVLGTMSGRKRYQIDSKDGLMDSQQEYYDLPEDFMPLVSKIPLELLVLPEQTREEFPAGTKFYFLRTDGESYVDVRLEDGRECRITFEMREWERLINGVSEWDCFEELYYAG